LVVAAWSRSDFVQDVVIAGLAVGALKLDFLTIKRLDSLGRVFGHGEVASAKVAFGLEIPTVWINGLSHAFPCN
jgi:hypothetical protein